MSLHHCLNVSMTQWDNGSVYQSVKEYSATHSPTLPGFEATASLTKCSYSARTEPLFLGEGNVMSPVSQPSRQDCEQQQSTSDSPTRQLGPVVGGPYAYYVLAVLF